jgi:hypothetical protein
MWNLGAGMRIAGWQQKYPVHYNNKHTAFVEELERDL